MRYAEALKFEVVILNSDSCWCAFAQDFGMLFHTLIWSHLLSPRVVDCKHFDVPGLCVSTLYNRVLVVSSLLRLIVCARVDIETRQGESHLLC